MSQLRHDPVQKRWVIIAEARRDRPIEFDKDKEEGDKDTHVKACPFCYGRESATPPEIWADRPNSSEPNTPGWKIRVIPNKFPALQIEGDINRRGLGLYDMMDGIGAHEVIIETPDHCAHMGDMSVEKVADIARVYRSRISDLYRDLRLRYILIFKNHRASAGASLSHPHSQLIATPITPRTVAAELESAREHYLQKERCLFCDIINQEITLKERVVYQNERFIVISPFASRFPFETWLLPKFHAFDFSQTCDEDILSFGDALKTILRKLNVVLNNPPFNFVLHTAPNYSVPRPGRRTYWETLPYDWHWHLEIIPRLTKIAGFEWGTGFYINSVLPEDATTLLSKAK